MSPTHQGRPVISHPRPRSIALTSTGGLLAVTLLACGHPNSAPNAPEASGTRPTASAPVPAGPPSPIADGLCPYLPAAAVQVANGQRVVAVRVSDTGPDRPYPACFFLTGNGAVQLRSWIVVSTPAAAHAAIDAAAPVATSDLVELPGGWSGGSQPTAEGAVCAVARHGTAVVITTNQNQTIPARQIAVQVIDALNL
jgi:UPF0176 protein